MKLARIAHVQAGQPQRKLIISRTRGYHGVAYGGTSAQGIAPNRENFGPFVGDVVQVPSDDVEALASADGRARRHGRRRADRAGAGRRRHLPAGRPVPAAAASAVRSARRVPDLRRGHHRLRPARFVVRRAALRRPARPGDLRQGGHQRLPTARWGVRRARAAGCARGRSRLLPAPRLHLLGPSHRLRRRADQPGDHAPRGPRRASHARRRRG